jgi:hypothetical protein
MCACIVYSLIKGKKKIVNKNFYLKVLKAFEFLIKSQEFN